MPDRYGEPQEPDILTELVDQTHHKPDNPGYRAWVKSWIDYCRIQLGVEPDKP